MTASDQGSRSTILISGATGVLGARLVHALRGRGHTIRALSPVGDPGRARLDGLSCEIVAGDVRDAAATPALFAGVDTVYHLAAVILARNPADYDAINRGGTAQMVAGAARAGVRHFVYVSSASVTYPQLTAYGQSKLAGEDLVKAGFPRAHTIVRPTLVYDEAGGQEFQLFLRHLLRFAIVPFIGDGRAWKRPVFAGDVVAGLAAIADNPRALGKTYNLSGGDRIRLIDLARLMLAQHGQRRRFVHVPVVLARAAAAVMKALLRDPPLTKQIIAGLVNDADLPPDDAQRDLGYQPLDVHTGFSRCFSRAAPPLHPPTVAASSVGKEIPT